MQLDIGIFIETPTGAKRTDKNIYTFDARIIFTLGGSYEYSREREGKKGKRDKERERVSGSDGRIERCKFTRRAAAPARIITSKSVDAEKRVDDGRGDAEGGRGRGWK